MLSRTSHQFRHHQCCAGTFRGTFSLPGTTRKYERSIPFHFKHLELDIQISMQDQQVSGTVTHHVERAAPGTGTLALDAVCFEIKKVEVDSGRGFKTARFEYDDELLQVNTGSRFKSGKVRIQYRARPQRGLYFLKPDKQVSDRPRQVWSQCQDEDARHWFPCHDKPHVKTTAEFKISVPDGYQVLCNGELESVEPLPAARGRKPRRGGSSKHQVFRYRMDVPLPSYLVTLVVGEFDIIDDRPAKLRSGREVPIQYWVPRGRRADGERAFSRTPDMIELFSKLTGVEYPYPRYTQIVVSDFTFGGMENTTATTMYEHILKDERSLLDIEPYGLVAHELAHQWFGDWVTCKDWSHAWLNEGFATYFEHVEAEHRSGPDEYLRGLEQDLQNYLTEAKTRYSRSIVTRDYEEPIDLFDRHLYEQGGLVLHMLRKRLGDKLFWQATRSYLNDHARGHATTEQLRQAFERASGESLERFFDEWLYGEGHPNLKVSVSWQDSELRIALEQRQRAAAFEIDFEAVIMLSTGKIQRVQLTMSTKHAATVLPLRQTPEYVAIDPELRIAGDLSLELPLAMLRNQLSKGQTPRQRRQAAELLAKRTDFKTLSALSKTLGKQREDWSVRGAAARALGEMRTEPALNALASAIDTEHPKLRAAIAQALGEFRSPESVRLLQAMLKKERAYLAEAAIVRALGHTGRDEVLPALQAALKRRSWADVVACAGVEGLAALENPKHAPLVKEQTHYGVPMAIRRAAITALPKIGKPAEVRKHLAHLLADPHPHVRLSVVGALQELEDGKSPALLRHHLDRETDGRVKRRTEEALHALKLTSHRATTEKLSKLEREMRTLQARLAMLEGR
jgi:aminopeptidase N